MTQTSPGGSGPTLESPLTQKLKPSGDLIHTYSDITKTPPVTTRITYRSSGDVEILITIGENRTLIDIHALTGLRRTRLWKDPDPEPQTWAKIESPKGGSQIAPSGNGSKGRHKPKKSARRPRPEKRRAAKRMPKKKKSKSKARRR